MNSPPVEIACQESVLRAICDNDYCPVEPTNEERATWTTYIVKYGVPDEDAE